jgi:hypothetical protein
MPERYNILWASQGIGGSGKSHLLLTAPEPIFVHLFDPDGLGPLLKKDEFKKRDIRWHFYNFQPGKLAVEDRPKAAKDALELFLENQQLALGKARTIGWDKEDHVYEMLRYARLEAYTDRPSSYYELNLEYRGWFADAAEAGVNLGVIRGMKEKWGLNHLDKPTALGELTPRGQKEVNELVQVVLDHRWDEEERCFYARIHEKCRVGNASELLGKELKNPDFMSLAFALYPETIDTPEVWL